MATRYGGGRKTPDLRDIPRGYIRQDVSEPSYDTFVKFSKQDEQRLFRMDEKTRSETQQSMQRINFILRWMGGVEAEDAADKMNTSMTSGSSNIAAYSGYPNVRADILFDEVADMLITSMVTQVPDTTNQHIAA